MRTNIKRISAVGAGLALIAGTVVGVAAAQDHSGPGNRGIGQTGQYVFFCFKPGANNTSSDTYIQTQNPRKTGCKAGYTQWIVASDTYQGNKGAKGDTGAAGPAGKRGPAGPKGEPGTAAAQGEKGDTGAPGKDGTDGKDGVSNLIAGAGYTQKWVGDGGATEQTSREECPTGQYALGGGFSTFGGDKDLGGDNKEIQVTVSAPYFEGDYKPVDEAGNFRPTEWVVKGFNNGTKDQVVRAWVTCADIPAGK